MDPLVLALLLAAAALGGGLNAVAGGGSFLTFPALLLAGVPPIPANATSALALWPGSVASAGAYRDDIRREGRVMAGLGVASVAGGLGGALILLETPEEVFRRLVPWLLLLATLVFAFAPAVLRRLRVRPHVPGAVPTARLASFGVAWLAIAAYGGYFGGGMGFLMLATLAAMGMQDVHAMNGIKVVLGAVLNGVAILAFAVAGVIVWPVGLAMALGSAAGGYAAATFAKTLPPARVRAGVVAAGAVMTALFFLRG